jgi:hypothetical protein
MHAIHRLTVTSIVAATALLLGGCSGSGAEPKTAPTSKEGAPPISGTTTQETQDGGVPVAANLAVLGSHKASADKFALQIDLNEVKVDGQVMTVTRSDTCPHEMLRATASAARMARGRSSAVAGLGPSRPCSRDPRRM